MNAIAQLQQANGFNFNLYNVEDRLYKKKSKVSYAKRWDFDTTGIITISAKEYGQQLTSLIGINGVTFKNDSDIMTDYFCKDSVEVCPESPIYRQVLQVTERMEEKNKKRFGYA